MNIKINSVMFGEKFYALTKHVYEWENRGWKPLQQWKWRVNCATTNGILSGSDIGGVGEQSGLETLQQLKRRVNCATTNYCIMHCCVWHILFDCFLIFISPVNNLISEITIKENSSIILQICAYGCMTVTCLLHLLKRILK